MNLPNSRPDLDSLKGSEAYLVFLRNLLGASNVRVDIAKYPEDYSSESYSGIVVTPVWEDQINESILSRFGFTLEGLLEEISREEPLPF